MSEHEIKEQLEAIFSVYRGTDYEDGVIGIAHSASATDLAPKVERHFELDQIDQAAKYADAKSKEGCNNYVVSGLLFGVKDQRSSAAHFYASKWVVVDVDENWERSRAAIKDVDLKPSIYVRTAETPETRVQAWFELNEITDGIDDVRAAGRALTATLCADASSIDTGTHLFRLAGTTNHPTEHKKANGRKAEAVALNIAKDAPKYDVYALSQLKPHPEYDHTPTSGVGKGGAALGIVRDENGKVTDGREDYWRSIVLAMISNYQKDNGADPTANEVFDDCYPTFERNITGDDRWTSHHGQLALRQRVCNTLRRMRLGRLAEHGLYSCETGVNQEKAETVAAARAERTISAGIDAKQRPFNLWGQFNPPAFPRGVLPPVLEDFAFTMGRIMGCDPAGLAMTALTNCAAAIPDSVKLKVKEHEQWTERACLWTGIIGPPSSKKSPTMKATAGPLEKINYKLMKEYQQAVDLWHQTKEGDRGEFPLMKRVVIDDATTEAIQSVLKGSPQGVLCVQDELSALFGRIEKYGGKGGAADRAFYLRLYNGGSYIVDRVNRGSYQIDNASICLVGGIQPEKLREIANGFSDDGMLQRITPVFLSPSKVGCDEPIPDVASGYEQLINDLSGHSAGFMGYSRLRFSPEAQSFRSEVERKNHELMSVEAFNTKLSARFGKYDGLFARLCVILHCIKTVGGNLREDVDLATAQAAYRLLYEFILPNDVCFYSGLLGMADNHDLITDIAGYILSKKCLSVSYRDLHRTTRKLKKTDHRDARRLFEQLAALGWGTVDVDPNPHSPPKFTVNPTVHDLYADRANQERARRQQVVALMNELGGQTT